jgi:hypothetical protein
MSVTLTSSDVITVVGVIVTLASIGWAIYERTQSGNAKKETKRFRRLLLKQQIAQQFSDVPERALTLFRHVRAKDWENGAEVALLLSSNLASLNGVHIELIGNVNKSQLGEALAVAGQINNHMPRSGSRPSTELEKQLLDGCQLMLVSVNAIERSLRIMAALGGDEDDE